MRRARFATSRITRRSNLQLSSLCRFWPPWLTVCRAKYVHRNLNSFLTTIPLAHLRLPNSTSIF